MNYEKKYFCQKELLERGWTKKAIEKWLPEPDLIKDNPYYKSSPPMKLYSIDKVIQIENSEEWQEWYKKLKSKREKISKAQKKRFEEMKLKLLKYISSIHIKIPKYKRDILFKLAVNHYNQLWSMREKYEKFIYQSDINNLDLNFLARISVNMLRHEFSCYESVLERLFGRVGKFEGYLLLKKRVLEEIAKTYEDDEIIKNEALRQINELEDNFEIFKNLTNK